VPRSLGPPPIHTPPPAAGSFSLAPIGRLSCLLLPPGHRLHFPAPSSTFLSNMAAIRAVSLAVSVLFFSLIAVSAAIHPSDDVTDLPASVAPHAATGMYGATNATISLSRSATAAASPRSGRDRPATLILFDRQLQSTATIAWGTRISYGGQAMVTRRRVTLRTADGMYAFPIPAVASCGAIRASTTMADLEGSVSDHGKCRRPALNLPSARTSAVGGVYCATVYYRHCRRRGLGWKRCSCRSLYTARVVLLDGAGRTMRVTPGGGFIRCGRLTSVEKAAARAVGVRLQ